MRTLNKRVRYGLVAFGVAVSEALLAATPTGDLNGDVELFPDAALWFLALLIAWAALMTGMFSGQKGRKETGPLIAGTIGAAILIAANV